MSKASVMKTLTRLIVDNDFGERVFTDVQLSRLIEGSSQRRYHLVILSSCWLALKNMVCSQRPCRRVGWSSELKKL